MTDDTILEAGSNAVAFAPLGETLAETRAAKKLSQQDVSNHLRFSVKQVDALESNNFDALPDAMITRGFIRNYARYLDLDAEPLLESYKARRPSKTPGPVSVQSTNYQVMSGKDSQPWLKYILGSILILLFLLAWIFYIDYLPKPNKANGIKMPEIMVPSVGTEVPLPEIALPAAERQADTDASSVVLPTPPQSAEAGTNPVTADPAAAPQAIEMPAAPVTPGTMPEGVSTANLNAAPQSPINPQPPSVAKSGANSAPTPNASVASPSAIVSNAAAGNPASAPISVSVTEKTWVNVKDKSGKVIYEKILTAGTADSINGEAPFNVVIGNAKATSLTYKGQAVNLSSVAGSNVARIKLE